MVERRTLLTGLAAAGAVSLIGCSGDDQAEPIGSSSPQGSGTSSTSGINPTVESVIAKGLNVPWGIVFLASGDALVSERDAGTVARISTDGKVTKLGDVPDVVGGREGGLLGIAVAPGDEGTLFAYVTTSSDDRIVRLSLDGDRLGSPTTILGDIPIGSRHHGGRLLFAPDGNMFVSTGDSGQDLLAQDKGSLAGKVLRITRDGDASPGNPFDNRTWSYGHRNIEGLAFDGDGRLWAAEFGASDADELNLITKGGNYGWPEAEGMSDNKDFINPKVTWRTDECSPAGIAITRSTAFVGALRGECVFAVPLDGAGAGKPKAYFSGDFGRVRSVAVAPDGALWVTTSNTDGRGDPGRDDDRILRVTL